MEPFCQIFNAQLCNSFSASRAHLVLSYRLVLKEL